MERFIEFTCLFCEKTVGYECLDGDFIICDKCGAGFNIDFGKPKLFIENLQSKLAEIFSEIDRIGERIDEIDKKLTNGDFRVYQDQLYDSRE